MYDRNDQNQQPYRISPGSIQPQPYPYPQPTVGGCTQKWARMRLRGGRNLDVFVTSIAEKSVGGFLSNGQQIAMNLDEILEMTC